MPPFLLLMMNCLLHNELLSVIASADEVDASVEFADVDAVDTKVAFNVHHSLTHDVVDHDVSVLVEVDVELVNGRIGIEAHVRVVAHFWHTNTDTREEVVQLEGEALVVVVGTIGIIALDESTGFTVKL